MKLEWLGYPGHFCAAADCQFRLHTHVGCYCVSTVGDYRPRVAGLYDGGQMQSLSGISDKAFYETMVFKLRKDGTSSGRDLACKRYETSDEAGKGHMRMIKLYAAKG